MRRKHLLLLNGMLFHLKLPLAFRQMSLTDKDRCLQGSKFGLTWLNQAIYHAIWDKPHFLPKLNDGCGETDVHFYHRVKIVYLWSWFDVRQQPFCRHLKLLPTLNYDALPKYNKKIFKITRNRLQRITLEFILFRMALPTLNHASYVHLCSIKHQNYSDRTHLTGIYWKK